MNDFKDRELKLETYEWDRQWIDNTEDHVSKRVLYIGDSISWGTRKKLAKLSDGNILFDCFATSKALDNPFFTDALDLFIKQVSKTDVVIFNNGIHGLHMNDDEEYGFYYKKMIDYLSCKFKNIPIFIVLTTFVKDEEIDKKIIPRNKTAIQIAKKYNLSVVDLYSVSKENTNLMIDPAHFNEEGYDNLAKKILSYLQ